jgi:opacity protein-like surface antigen
MKKLVGMVLLVFLMAGLAVAQDSPKVELFGGYQFLRASGNDFSKMLNGWRASVAGNLNEYIGVEASFTGTYGDFYDIDGLPDNPDTDVNARINNYTYLFGPRFTVRNDRVTGFAHVLFGGSRLSISAAASDPYSGFSSNDFAWGVGGGLDLNFVEHVAVRPVQIDYIQLRTGEDVAGNLNTFGYSAGLVIKF